MPTFQLHGMEVSLLGMWCSFQWVSLILSNTLSGRSFLGGTNITRTILAIARSARNAARCLNPRPNPPSTAIEHFLCSLGAASLGMTGRTLAQDHLLLTASAPTPRVRFSFSSLTQVPHKADRKSGRSSTRMLPKAIASVFNSSFQQAVSSWPSCPTRQALAPVAPQFSFLFWTGTAAVWLHLPRNRSSTSISTLRRDSPISAEPGESRGMRGIPKAL